MGAEHCCSILRDERLGQPGQMSGDQVEQSLRCRRDKLASIQQTRGIHAFFEFLGMKTKRSNSSPSRLLGTVEMRLVHLGSLSSAANGFFSEVQGTQSSA